MSSASHLLGKAKCRVRETRHARGWSLKYVAERTGFTKGGMSQLERGIPVSLTTARTIAKFYGLSVDYLWPDGEDT